MMLPWINLGWVHLAFLDGDYTHADFGFEFRRIALCASVLMISGYLMIIRLASIQDWGATVDGICNHYNCVLENSLIIPVRVMWLWSKN